MTASASGIGETNHVTFYSIHDDLISSSSDDDSISDWEWTLDFDYD